MQSEDKQKTNKTDKYVKLNFNLKRIIFEFTPFFTITQIYGLDKSSKSVLVGLKYFYYLKQNLSEIIKIFELNLGAIKNIEKELIEFSIGTDNFLSVCCFLMRKK